MQRFLLPASESAAFLARVEQHLRAEYGARPGFELRQGLFWPRERWRQAQLNLFLGPRAGLEISYEQRPGADEGTLTIRVRNRLEFRALACAALAGAALALVVFVLFLVDGLGGDTFVVAYPVRAFGGPHLSGGAIVLYALLPALATGLLVFLALWPLRWVARLASRSANRAARLPSPAELARELRSDRAARGAAA